MKQNMEINNKVIKWVSIGIEVAFLITFVFLCIAVGNRNKHIKQYKSVIAQQEITIDSLTQRCDRLGSVDCIYVETSCIINNKGLVNVSQTNQISKTVATYTRDQFLDAVDSLNKVNNNR